MTIRTKVIGCFIGILFLFITVFSYNYLRFRKTNERLILVNELFLPLSRLIAQLQSNVHNHTEELRRFYLQSPQTVEGASLSRMVRDLYPYLIRKKINEAEHLLSKQSLVESPVLISELSSRLSAARLAFDNLSSASDPKAIASWYAGLRADLSTIAKRSEDECQKVTLEAQSEGRESLFASAILSIAVLLLGALTILLSHRTLRPLPLLVDRLKKIADGDFHQNLKVSTSDKDEVSLIAREYNRMLAALCERDRKIQRQQKDLVQSERLAAVGQLSAEVVHEIRNPLNSISLNIDWLQIELANAKEEVARTLKSISKEITRLNQITESYLIRSRVSVPEHNKTAVNDLLREILDFSREEDKARNIAVETFLSNHELFVRSDRARLKQAFLNVLKNAREAMPRGGKMVVRSELKDNVYRVEFEDSGYGMNESTLKNTFHPFFTTKHNGTGLGLLLTKEIVEEAQGSISCESQLGVGTKFTLQFPV